MRTGWLRTPQGGPLLRDGFWVGTATSEEEVLAIAASLGEPVRACRTAPLLHLLMPVAAGDAPAYSLSAAHGLGEFPFHTDGAHHRRPPRWVVMRCAEPGPGGRPTLLADGARLPLNERQWREVERAVWWVRSGGRGFPTSIVKRWQDQWLVRYDRGCMTPADRAFVAAGELFEETLHGAAYVRLQWQRNAVVVFDNWRMLHARGAADGGDAGIRCLQRILVQ